MKSNYWKVICRYGHVGLKNEVSVARYISLEGANIFEVFDLVSKMPGVKNKGISQISPIDKSEYYEGKILEDNNFYLQRLRTFKPNALNMEGDKICA